MNENNSQEDSIRESVVARNLMKKLGKKKIRIKRLVKKKNGEITLRDTTVMNQTNDSIPNSAIDSSLYSQVDYKFTRNKDADSFHPDMNFSNANFQSADPFQKKNMINNFQSNDHFSKNMNFSKKQKKSEMEQITTKTTNKVETFTQMIEKDMRNTIEKKTKKMDTINEKQSVFNSVTVPSISSNSEYSTESVLFRLPSKTTALMENVESVKDSVRQQVEEEKKLTLDKLEVFKNKLISTIENRLKLYKNELIKEYDDFYNSYEEDLEYMYTKCDEYKSLPRNDIDINKNKIKFRKFDYLEEGKEGVMKTESSEIITFPENVPIVAKKKELNYLVENLEKRMLHIPGFAKTETANECMQETVGNLDQFCEKNLEFLGNVLYKTEYVPLRKIRVNYEVESTNIPSSRQSISRFKGNEMDYNPPKLKNVINKKIEKSKENKEIHNIWKDSIDKHRERESRGERDELTEQELKKREEMLNSMKVFDEQVKQYQEKMKETNEKEELELLKKKEEAEVIDYNHNPNVNLSGPNNQESDFKINSITQNSRDKLVQENLIMNNEVIPPPKKEQKQIIEPVIDNELTEEQKMIIEQNRAKQELFLKKQSELKYNEGKSTYEKMSVYSMKEEHLDSQQTVNKEELAKQNAEKLNEIMNSANEKNSKLENLLDKNQFKEDQPTPPKKEEKKEEQKQPKVDIEAIMNKQKLEEMKKMEAQKVLGITFKRSNISIEKIVKGKKLNGVSQSGDKLFFFGEEFIFKCTLNFQNPLMYKIGGKELTFMRSVEEEVGPDHYLLGIINKQRNVSEVLLIRLTNQFSLLKRICVEENQASGIINIFNIKNQKQFITVTRFGEVHLYDYGEPMIQLVAKETLNGERIETAILTAKETSVCLVSQNSQIIGFEIEKDPNSNKAVNLSKTRILPLDNQANDIVKISEDQVGYCDEDGKFSILTLPMQLNGNKLGIKKTSVCDFPVDRLFVLESKPNDKLDYRTDVISILMLNYEGHVAVFNFKNRKSQTHFDPKLVEEICLHSQNAILSKRNENQNDILILSTKTLKKLIVSKKAKE
jgi:hypothetical protein